MMRVRWFIFTFQILDRILERSLFCIVGDRYFHMVFRLSGMPLQSWGYQWFTCWLLWLLQELLCCYFFCWRVPGYICWYCSWVLTLCLRVFWRTWWEWIQQYDRLFFFQEIWQQYFGRIIDCKKVYRNWNCRLDACFLF